MRILIVDDDFICRNLLLEMVKEFGTCSIAVNGSEAVTAVENAIKTGESYDLIFLDIMLEGMDGQEVLKKIRGLESMHGVGGFDGSKIIMTSVLHDFENIKTAFSEQCEGYIVKPITRDKVVQQMRDLRLVQ